MAITRLHQTGFELNELVHECHFNSSGAAVSSLTPKTGTYNLAVSNDNIGWFIPTTSQIRLGFYFKFSGVGSGTPEVFSLWLGQSTEVIKLTYTLASDTFTLYSGATVLGTVIPGLTLATWYHFGVDIKINAAGWANFYIDGVQQIAFSGDTNDGGATIDKIVLGTTTGLWTTARYDDVYADDLTGEVAPVAVPLKQFLYVTPGSDGYLSQWDGSDGNSVDNHNLVDDVPPNEVADFLYTQTAAERDSYTMTNITLSAGQFVVAVIPQAVAYNPAGANPMHLFTRVGGVNTDSGDKTVLPDWTTILDRQVTKPGGGSWTEADVNGMEVGIATP